jgi:hypothetical protein
MMELCYNNSVRMRSHSNLTLTFLFHAFLVYLHFTPIGLDR